MSEPVVRSQCSGRGQRNATQWGGARLACSSTVAQDGHQFAHRDEEHALSARRRPVALGAVRRRPERLLQDRQSDFGADNLNGKRTFKLKPHFVKLMF